MTQTTPPNAADTSSPRYAIITPAHNEAAMLPRVVASIAAQTRPPSQWIILDDRSTDYTWTLLRAAEKKHAFIRAIKLSGQTGTALGAHIARIFREGLQYLPDVDFIGRRYRITRRLFSANDTTF